MDKMYRVLLANSSEDYSANLAAVLKQSDRYAVVGTANDGIRAIELLREVKPEFLVVDMMLPQADGVAVLKAAIALEKKPMLLVLADFMTEFVSNLLVSLGVLFGVSAHKALKYLTPFIALFAAFSAFQMLYPHHQKLQDMATGNYKDRFVEFSDTEEAPDFV